MVYLAYTGVQNMFLTEEPDFSHFKTVYVRDTPYVTQSIEVPFDNNKPRPGDTITCTIPQKGEYIGSLSLKLILPPTVTTSANWMYSNPQQNGQMYAFASNGTVLFTLTLSGADAYSNNTSWFTGGGVTVTSPPSNKFSFATSAPVSYVVFTNASVANFFGFVYNPQSLFGGYTKFSVNATTNSFSSQVTFQESGWLPVTSGTTAYIDNVVYKFLNSASLFVGNQLIQKFDSTSLQSYNETSTTYKNRPIFKLLYGNTSIVDFNRTYYMSFPFIEIPFHALQRHDVKVVVETNPYDYYDYTASVVAEYYLVDSSVKLPSEYTIRVPQIARFDTETLDSRGPMRRLSTLGAPDFLMKMNGEPFIDSDMSNVSAFENLLNIPSASNVITFGGTFNTSRIRDQQFVSSNTIVYTETINFLRVANGMAGLMFDYSSTVMNRKLDGSIKI